MTAGADDLPSKSACARISPVFCIFGLSGRRAAGGVCGLPSNLTVSITWFRSTGWLTSPAYPTKAYRPFEDGTLVDFYARRLQNQPTMTAKIDHSLNEEA